MLHLRRVEAISDVPNTEHLLVLCESRIKRAIPFLISVSGILD